MRPYLILAALCAAFVLMQNAAPAMLFLDGGLHYDARRDGEVVLLSTATCPYCDKVRRYLEAGGVPYRELDIERDPEGLRRFAAAGEPGVPVLLVGNNVVRGYDPEAIRAAFGARPD